MTSLSRRNAFRAFAVCIGIIVAVRVFVPNPRAASAHGLYDVVTSAGGYIVTHELSNHWTINVESAHSLTSTDCDRICAVLDQVPSDVTIGLVANTNNPAHSVGWIAKHARCNSMALVCANGPRVEIKYLIDAVPDKALAVRLYCNDDIEQLLTEVKDARPNATFTTSRYHIDP